MKGRNQRGRDGNLQRGLTVDRRFLFLLSHTAQHSQLFHGFRMARRRRRRRYTIYQLSMSYYALLWCGAALKIVNTVSSVWGLKGRDLEPMERRERKIVSIVWRVTHGTRTLYFTFIL